MNPSLYAVVAHAALLALALIGWATVEDRRASRRAERFRRFGGELPTLSGLPLNINEPTVLRREVGGIW